MKKRLGGIALVALAGALVFAVGCEKEPTREEMSTKTIGGAMVKRTLETAAGTAKRDKEADARVKRALDRDFGTAPSAKGGNGDGK